MKKGFLITVIAVAVIGIAVGIGVGVAKEGSHSVNNVVKSSANNGTSNNFNNNSSNNGGSTSSGSESSSNRSASSNSGSSSSSSSSNSTSSSSETKLNVGLKNQAALSALAPQYLQEFENLIAQANNITNNNQQSQNQMDDASFKTASLWNDELNKLYGDIEKNLTPKEAEFLKNQENEWVNYKNNAIKKIGDQPWCSMIPLLQGSRATQMNQERCYYLFFYYLDNNNTNLDLSGLVSGNTGDALSQFNSIENYANNAISNSKTTVDLVNAYNNINNKWINEIDNVYQKDMNKCGNSSYEINSLRTPEQEWVNFKSNELNMAQNYYSSSDMGSIASNKVSIALTKAKIFTLLNF